MSSTVLIETPVYVGQQTLPSPSANGTVRHLVDASGVALIDGLHHAPITVAANAPPAVGVAFQKGFFGDYFNHVYVIPAVLSLVDPAIGLPTKFYFWNTNFNAVQVTQIESINSQGLTVEANLPLTLGDVKLVASAIVMDASAPTSETAQYTFTLQDGSTFPWKVNLLRTNLLQVTPETPVTEVLKWKTAVDAAIDGTEQRATLNHYVRIEHQVNYVFLDDGAQKTAYEQFTTQLNGSFSYPVWTEQTRLLGPVLAGQSSMSLDVTKFDLQVGDRVAFMSADEELFETVQVDRISPDQKTITITGSFSHAWGVEDAIFRVTTVRVQDKPSLERGPYGFTQAKVTLRITEFRDLFAADTATHEIGKGDILGDRVLTGLVNTLDGLPIIQARPIVDDTSKAEFDWHFEIFDYDIGTFDLLTDRIIANVTYDRKFYIKNLTQKFYWNWVLSWLDGRRRPVWLPTWLNDVGAEITTITGSAVVTNSELFYSRYTADDSHRGLWIAYEGGYLARKITKVSTDGQGHTVISLDQSVPDGFPANGPYEVGFLVLARQATDEVQREWHPFYSFLSTSFVSTKTSPEVI